MVALGCTALLGCSTDGTGEMHDGGPDLADGGTPSLGDEELSTASGCSGVYNPDQMLDYYIDFQPGDWSALRADLTNSIYFEAQFRCGDEAPITVGVRRKRSGGSVKIGLKVDMNQFVSGQKYYGLKKFSLENGVSEGDTEDGAEVKAYVSEYLAWRLMVLSGAVSGRAVFARIHVDGELIGVYINVEQVDKRFLKHRLGDDTGWLYKKSGGAGDGFKTHETDGMTDPYLDYFCFWATGGNACPVPPVQELAADLPARLDITQMLLYGAVNAIMANADSLLFKDNNYYWYDWPGGRTYLPWDLDTVMKETFDVFAGGGGGGGTDVYTEVLFSNWENDYAAILDQLLNQTLTLEVINGELDRAEAVAAPGFAADPYVTGTMAEAVESLKTYWAQRHPDVQARVAAH